MPLRCAECSLITGEFARGWRAFLTDDEWVPVEIVVLCPTCSEREPDSQQRLDVDDERD